MARVVHRARTRHIAAAIVSIAAVVLSANHAQATSLKGGAVDVKFSQSISGRMRSSVTPPQCVAEGTTGRVVTLDGSVGKNEYIVSMRLRGPQPTGTFPVGASDNQGVVTVQKVATKASPTTEIFLANTGSVVAKGTSGSLDADLLKAGRDQQPLHLRGTWKCATRAKHAKK